MEHPLPDGTKVIANIDACPTCNLDYENHQRTYIRKHVVTDGDIVYTLGTNHKVVVGAIIEVLDV